jgi:ABC-type oligopeptide transport system substrate-binding subunit
MLPPSTIGHNDSTPTFWNYNLTDAQGNLTAAATDLGFNQSHPQTVSIAYGIGDSIGQAAATEMATNINNMNLGITIQPTPIPGSLLIGQLVGGTIQMYVLEYPNPISDPSQYLTAFGVTQEAAFQGYNNSMVKSLVINQSSELNQTLRLQMVSQINYLMNKDVFEIWLYYPSVLGQGGNGGVGQIFRSWVHGFQYNTGRANLGLYGLYKA